MNDEAKKFDEYGREWWDPKGRLFSLHRINPLRFEYFRDVACRRLGGLEGKKVLDVGCGGGLLSERFAAEAAAVTAIDLSPVAIEAAKGHAAQSGLHIDYRVCSVEELKAAHEAAGEPSPYDIVVCAEVLEHVDDPAAFLAGALSMLGPGGLFFFGTINRTLRARLLAIFVAEDILGMVPPGTHEFRKFIKPSHLKEIMESCGVTMEGLRGMSFSPWRLEFVLSDDTTVNYLGYGVKRRD
ncbi:MAG TPA: bifunctional 2-polyprenyl-6-hydroxyphenol methylase/3-demethylubiquinol 3-O-methyltransferase UbiG [Deltaproteobacteria bacterium]|nr:bifunctional 2-polyprenyl-6-hydroxyphenol methylase/3-demethylubiquinol 3-O-methyltransferase UbiG [Deltaproteobacteria bacterium]